MGNFTPFRPMDFQLLSTDPTCAARAGEITTEHGTIQTPIFMPVGTAGSVKAVQQRELVQDIKAEIILGNTYHLYLRPGIETIEQGGGLHQFMGWDGPILTDSGGYQVYSLAANRKINEEGVTFRSHIDGSAHTFTPEKVVDIQRVIGADIIMALDECTPYPCGHDYAGQSLRLTHKWYQRCLDQFESSSCPYGHRQSLFPIVQGSVYPDLRKESAEIISSFNADGNAIGGLSVGEEHDQMYEMTQIVCEILPKDKPRYLMGVGTPANILESIALGVDMFDCVMPTRNGRNGTIFTSKGIINIRNEKWKNDFSPVDDDLGGYVSSTYSKSYLRHLIISKEILGAQIASIHNLTFYLWLVKSAREKIIAGDFLSWKNEMTDHLTARI